MRVSQMNHKKTKPQSNRAACRQIDLEGASLRDPYNTICLSLIPTGCEEVEDQFGQWLKELGHYHVTAGIPIFILWSVVDAERVGKIERHSTHY